MTQQSIDKKVDFAVIGGGSGGVRAARIAASLGAKVVLIERDALGGTCVNRGCVPKKFLVYAATMGREQKQLADTCYGWHSSDATFNWAELKHDSDAQIKRLNTIYADTLNKHDVDIIKGSASFVSNKVLHVDKTTIEAESILIAVGGTPNQPDIEGCEHAMVSDDIFAMDELPKSILVVGGGYIALEFVNIFEGLGAKTCLAYRGDLFLRGFDDSLRIFLRDQMLARGMDLRFGVTPKSIKKQNAGFKVDFDNGDTIECDAVMYAIGRNVAAAGLGMENTAVQMDERGRIKVDAGYATDDPNIYALGDVIGGLELTPVAIAQGEYLAHRLFGKGDGIVDLDYVPTAIFSHPELATVGMTEDCARALYPDTAVFNAEFVPLRNSMVRGSQAKDRCMIKIIATSNAENAAIVGAHMGGAAAAEIMQIMAVALKSGATLNELSRTIGLHPSTAEEFVTLYKP